VQGFAVIIPNHCVSRQIEIIMKRVQNDASTKGIDAFIKMFYKKTETDKEKMKSNIRDRLNTA
jgi:hypothetical protein